MENLPTRIWAGNDPHYDSAQWRTTKDGRTIKPKWVWQDPDTGVVHHKQLSALKFLKKAPQGRKIRCDWPGCRFRVLLPDDMRYIIEPNSMYFVVEYGDDPRNRVNNTKYLRKYKIYFHEKCYYSYIKQVVRLGKKAAKNVGRKTIIKNKYQTDVEIF